MGHQFNYELDDRQIKLTMLNASLPYDEDAWEKFRAIPVVSQKSVISASLPKLEIGISRSVIVPIIFVVMIGGLSTLLFSIIDFKKKDTTSTEIPLIQPEIVKKEIKITTPTLVKKEPQKTEAIAIKSKTVTNTPITTATVAAIKKDVTPINKPVIENAKVIQQTNVNKAPVIEIDKLPVQKKRKRKEATEEIPVIIPQTTITNETPASEPDIITNEIITP